MRSRCKSSRPTTKVVDIVSKSIETDDKSVAGTWKSSRSTNLCSESWSRSCQQSRSSNFCWESWSDRARELRFLVRETRKRFVFRFFLTWDPREGVAGPPPGTRQCRGPASATVAVFGIGFRSEKPVDSTES